MGARQITVREQPADVHVLSATRLVRWLTRRPSTVDQQHRERLGALVSDASSWTADPAGPADVQRFAEIRREVAGARRTRLLWATGALLGVMTALAGVAVTGFSSLLG